MNLMEKVNSMFPFPILGTEDVPQVGRDQIVKRIWSDLTKATPSNLSIVGPRYIGKSVVLNTVAELARTDEGSPYKLVVYWELGHAPPQSDEEFIDQLCDQLLGVMGDACLLYTSPSPRDRQKSRMPSSA